jgi:putative phosphoserine phosphatase/1-acylglycerol-3-phosphate O-acyltransferase
LRRGRYPPTGPFSAFGHVPAPRSFLVKLIPDPHFAGPDGLPVSPNVGDMARVAAIFDLDRTVLRGPSGPAINDALVEFGLRGGKIFGEAALYRTYELFGENPFGIALARAAAFGVRGWSVDRMQAAGRRVAELLAPQVGSYVPSLLADHRRAGHVLVLATTTPDVLIRPLARQLGFDEVIGTRYAWRDGAYTGALDGGFVWGPGKLAAVRRWAASESVELRGSFAYSDSVYDLPLLSAVGNPAATNPDSALHAVALVRRWPIMHLDSPPGVVTLWGAEAFDLAKRAIRPELFPYARFDIDGIERIPDAGPFLLVSNHRSYFDVAALALVVARKGRRTRFLAKKELFDAPVVGQIARALGGISVERQGTAADALAAAQRVLAAGEGLVILPQGTIPRGRAFYDPVLRGKTGAARLAARSGAPVIPVALWNTEAVWTRSSKLPNVTRVLSPPRVRVRVGPPVAGLGLRRDDARQDTEAIMAAISALLPDEAHVAHDPTEEELRRTYPSGRAGEERALGVDPVRPGEELARGVDPVPPGPVSRPPAQPASRPPASAPAPAPAVRGA